MGNIKKMFRLIKKMWNDKFLRNSFILTVSFFILNTANFFYHFFAARQLGPESYSVIASLFSIIYLFSVGSNVIQTSITKFAAIFYAKKSFGKLKFLKNRALRKLSFYSLGLFLVYLAISPLIAIFLHIELLPVLITGILILFIFILPVNRGILQGIQKFSALGLNLIIEGVVKLVLVVIFILIGWEVNGALGAVVLGTFFAFIFSFSKIKGKLKKFDTKAVYSYSLPVIFAILSITAMFSLDLLLVKHLFLGKEAGYYSALSLLGKIVFFGATAISLVMFSKVSELHARKVDTKKILKKAMAITGFIAIFITIVYFIFSGLITSIIFGEEYFRIIPLLGPFGVFMTFMSLIYILTLYKLSIDKKKFVYLLGLFNIIQVVGIYLLSDSLTKIVYFLIAFSAVLFFSLLMINRE